MIINRQDTVTSKLNASIQYAGNFSVYVYPVGAVVKQTTAVDTVKVYRTGSVRPGDRLLIWRPSTFTLIDFTNDVFSVIVNDTIDFGAGAQVPVQMFDRLINLGPDQGTQGTPNWDKSKVGIYADPSGLIRIPKSVVLTNATDGRFQYYHKLDGMAWEVVQDSTGLIVGLQEGFDGDIARLNVEDFGNTDDPAGALAAATLNLDGNQTEFDPGI
jgi:hypothetical protein